jgi:DNA-binding response OmpR family regulator
VLRRSGATTAQPEACRFGDVEVDFVRFQATKAGRPLEMSPREYRLLGYFVSRTGQVVTREELLSAVWGYDKSSMSRTVDTHVAKLRKKVEDSPESPRYILTVHGAGYRFTG